jgi:hypothetical protein
MTKSVGSIVCILGLILAMTATLIAADPSFAGTWKLNLSRSQLSGVVYTFEKKPSGVMHYSGGGFDTDFDLAGKEYTMPNGTAIIGKEINPTTWELTFKLNGKLVSKSKVTLSNNQLAWVSDMIGADGKTVQQTSTDPRVGSGSGFVGKWKAGDVKGSATTLKITLQGTNGITFETPEAQTAVKANFDGKDYPFTQAGQATKMTLSVTRTGNNAFSATLKMNGKPFSVDVYTISADGKTLTDESTTTATNEKTKSVFERQ